MLPNKGVAYILFTVVRSTHKHIVLIYCNSINDGIMPGNVPQVLSFWTFPYFYIVGGSWNKSIFNRVER